MTADHSILVTFVRFLHINDAPAALDWLKRHNVSPEHLTALLIRHELAGYSFAMMTDSMMMDWFPNAEQDKLSTVYQKQVWRNERLLQLITDMHTKLDAADIPFLLIKGFYLSMHYAGGIDRRLMWDQDILVHPEDMDKSVAVAMQAGLRNRSRWPLDPRRLFWRMHAVELSGSSRKLDIHCAFRNLPGMRLDYEKIWLEQQPFLLNDVEFRTINDEHTLVILALGLASDIQCSNIKLRKLWDLYLVLNAQDSEIDWETFFACRQEEGILKVVVNVFTFCLQVLDAEIECPQLIRAMHRFDEQLLVRDSKTAVTIMQRRYKHLANRLLFARIQSASVTSFWVWWLITLPVRFLHYSKT